MVIGNGYLRRLPEQCPEKQFYHPQEIYQVCLTENLVYNKDFQLS